MAEKFVIMTQQKKKATGLYLFPAHLNMSIAASVLQQIFQNKNLKGKIALIQRAGEENGEVLTFAQKESNAKNAGAIAAIIYDNVDGALINMSTDNKIPCVFISKADGEYLCGQPDKKLSVSEDYVDTFKDNYSGKNE